MFYYRHRTGDKNNTWKRERETFKMQINYANKSVNIIEATVRARRAISNFTYIIYTHTFEMRRRKLAFRFIFLYLGQT